MADLKSGLKREEAYLTALRRDFHRHPELGLREFRTAQRIEEELDRFGISHTRVGGDRRTGDSAGKRHRRGSSRFTG